MQTNSYGNVDVRHTLPAELIHIPEIRITPTLKELNIEFAKALIDFRKNGRYFTPVFNGIVINKKDKRKLLKYLRDKKTLTPAQKKEQREKRQKRDTDNFLKRLEIEFPNMPPLDREDCAEHATEIGSRRVGRSSMCDNPVMAAVIAYVRHNYTDYDDLYKYSRDRESNVSAVNDEIYQIINSWK